MRLPHGHQVGQHLSGVEFIGESIPHRHAGMFRQRFNAILPESAIFYAVIQTSQHAGCIPDGFLVSDLVAGRPQIGGLGALIKARDFKCAAGSGRIFFKDEHYIFIDQIFSFPAALFVVLEL